MSTVTVFTPAEFCEALRKDDKCFKVSAKKDAKLYKGAMFFNNSFTNVMRNGQLKQKADAWVNVTGPIELSAIQDPSQKKDDAGEYKPTFTFKKKAAGDFGTMLELLEPQWQARINDLYEAGVIKKSAQCQIHSLMQYTYSDKHPTKAGEPMEDPTIRGKIDFQKFPEKYYLAFLSGMPKTTILDYDKPVVDPVTGVAKYLPATVVNDAGVEEPVSFENLHKFVTRGSIAHRMRIDLSTSCKSQYWISLQILVQEIVIQRGKATGFDEDDNGFGGATPTHAHANVEGGEGVGCEGTGCDEAEDGGVAVEPVDDNTAAAAIADI